MYMCRHCTEDDFYRLDELIKGFCSLEKDLDKALEYTRSILKDIEAFDEDIARRLSFTLSGSLEKEEKVKKLYDYLEELRQNVIIDVYEHNEK